MTKSYEPHEANFESGLETMAIALANAGFSEAALLVGAASLSVAETLLLRSAEGPVSAGNRHRFAGAKSSVG